VNPWLKFFLRPVLVFAFTGCANAPSHQFAEPAPDWKTLTGQLLFRSPKATVIGDVVVRYSTDGDFELTFSKGPGVTLLALQEDSSFAEIKGPLSGRGWSGPIDRAPEQLRGWLELKDKIAGARDRRLLRHSSGQEKFVLHF
jgi:hypothetical protein